MSSVDGSAPPTRKTRAAPQPSYQDVVQTICTFVHFEEIQMSRRGISEPKAVKREVWKCLGGERCKNRDSLIRFTSNLFFKNPFSHLQSCIGNGIPDEVYKLFYGIKRHNRKSFAHMVGTEGDNQFEKHVTQKDEELYERILMITMKVWALNKVNNEDYWKVLKHKSIFSWNTIRKE